MEKCESESRINGYKILDDETHSKGMITEEEFERDCFLSILSNIKRININMMEVGAGWGRMCIDLAGIINNNIIQIVPEKYSCYAVEAEPTHYKWLKEHFDELKINGTTKNCAVSDNKGSCFFDTSEEADKQYGQAIARITPKNIIRILKGQLTEVPTFTLDSLIMKSGFDKVDILDLDIQGYEYKALLGAKNSISQGLIDYLLIGIHSVELSEKIRTLLKNRYDCIVDLPPKKISKLDGFNPISFYDGIQVFKRIGL
jgi:FkbM family methyltransferase